MAVKRQTKEILLTDTQRDRLERLWFVYGNHGPKRTPGNHTFIQGFLEHGLDLRDMRGWEPTKECEAAVDAVLASDGGAGLTSS
jgi:hypothetical protein